MQEPKLLPFAYALEQALQPRTAPTYAGTLQPLPPDPGICAALPDTRPGRQGYRYAAGRFMRTR